MEGSTDADYVYLKKFCKDIEMKNLGEYYYLYVQNDTLLLVDVFENFRNMFLKIYPLDLGKFLSVPGLEWQAVSKNWSKTISFNWYRYIINRRKGGVKGGICHSI